MNTFDHLSYVCRLGRVVGSEESRVLNLSQRACRDINAEKVPGELLAGDLEQLKCTAGMGAVDGIWVCGSDSQLRRQRAGSTERCGTSASHSPALRAPGSAYSLPRRPCALHERSSGMEEELAWETHGCEFRCRGRVDPVGARGPWGDPAFTKGSPGRGWPFTWPP